MQFLKVFSSLLISLSLIATSNANIQGSQHINHNANARHHSSHARMLEARELYHANSIPRARDVNGSRKMVRKATKEQTDYQEKFNKMNEEWQAAAQESLKNGETPQDYASFSKAHGGVQSGSFSDGNTGSSSSPSSSDNDSSDDKSSSSSASKSGSNNSQKAVAASKSNSKSEKSQKDQSNSSSDSGSQSNKSDDSSNSDKQDDDEECESGSSNDDSRSSSSSTGSHSSSSSNSNASTSNDDSEAKPSSSSSAEAPKKTTSKSKDNSNSSSSSNSGNNSKSGPSSNSGSGILSGVKDILTGGQGTFFTPGLGSCGGTNSDSDYIVALSAELMDQHSNGNPNTNPLCGKKIKVEYQGKEVEATVTDTCPPCALHSIDFSPAAFNQLSAPEVGRISGLKWGFLN